MTPRFMLLIALVASVAVPHAQDPDPQSPIQLALKIGGESYVASARGTCLAQPHGTLYEVPAPQWNARHRDNGRYVNLAFWRVQNEGDMFSLGVLVGPTMHKVNTVKVRGKGTVQGQGVVRFAPNGSGGTFTIDATAASGVRIIGTITCGAFTRPVEENG